MKTFLVASLIFIIFISFASSLLITFIPANNPKQATVTIRNQSFAVEVADTDEKRAKGLSGRNSLDAKQGLLFVFNQTGFYSFWMKEMRFPIDILFIKDDKIVTIAQSVPKPKDGTAPADLLLYKPAQAANYVLEINAGLSQKYGFQENDSVKMTFP